MRGALLVLFVALLGGCGGDDKGGPSDTTADAAADAAQGADATVDIPPAKGLFNMLRVSVVPLPPSSLKIVGTAGAAQIAPGTMTVTAGSAEPVTAAVADNGSFSVTLTASLRATIHIEIAGSKTESSDFIVKNGKLVEQAN